MAKSQRKAKPATKPSRDGSRRGGARPGAGRKKGRIVPDGLPTLVEMLSEVGAPPHRDPLAMVGWYNSMNATCAWFSATRKRMSVADRDRIARISTAARVHEVDLQRLHQAESLLRGQRDRIKSRHDPRMTPAPPVNPEKADP